MHGNGSSATNKFWKLLRRKTLVRITDSKFRDRSVLFPIANLTHRQLFSVSLLALRVRTHTHTYTPIHVHSFWLKSIPEIEPSKVSTENLLWRKREPRRLKNSQLESYKGRSAGNFEMPLKYLKSETNFSDRHNKIWIENYRTYYMPRNKRVRI